MATLSSTTEAVIRNHLQAFREHRGIDAILADYSDDAILLHEDRVHLGRNEIRQFFEGFLAGLPDGAAERFLLRSLRVDGALGFITWSAGPGVPLGTDTFLVRDGKIASQTAAAYLPGAA